MGRFLGNRFGDAVPINPGSQGPSAVYPINDQYYIRREGGWVIPTSMDASGGTKNNYQSGPGQWYQSHTFTEPGTLVISGLGLPTNPPDYSKCEYLIVGGGGGGGGSGWQGFHATGGGGGGQIMSNAGGTKLQLAVMTATITVGEGGEGGHWGDPGPANCDPGTTGGQSSIVYTAPTLPPSPADLVAAGGGGANGSQTGGQPPWAGTPGGGNATGSGCGGSPWPTAAPGQTSDAAPHPNSTDLASPTDGFGAPGGGGPQNSFAGGGGGGAVQPGANSPTNNTGGAGGNGAQYSLETGIAKYYADGGGGGGGHPGGGTGGEGGYGGGGDGVNKPAGIVDANSGEAGTGGGGGGGANTPGGRGGSGTVIIRWMTNSPS